MQFKQGDSVVIQSPTSVFRGCVGTFVKYREGKHPDICLIELLNGHKVQICERNLGKSEDEIMSWDSFM